MSAYVPYGAYWSTPFSRWQGSLSGLHSLKLAAHVGRQELDRRKIPDDAIDWAVLGTTVPQSQSFYGLPWVTGAMGLGGVTGPTVNQACATGARILAMASHEVREGSAQGALVLSADRCSNGPHVYYPAPQGPGGTGEHEDWVLDNFSCDPHAGCAMVDTAENVAEQNGFSTEQQHELVLRRTEQYGEALAEDRAFQRRYMTLPFEVPDPRFRKTRTTLEGDEGVVESSAEGLARLRPVKEGGTVTFGGQTHPADGGCGLLVTTQERARELASDPTREIELLGFGMARAEAAHMPRATVPAAQRALERAAIDVSGLDAIKTHNPFAVNDLYFAQETGADLSSMNNFGCSLIWGHPQGPTGLRSVIELIEELALRGGGVGLFTGCAAGDSAMAVVLRVG